MQDSAGEVPVTLPDLGVATARVVQWLVAPGAPVNAGDRIVELLAGGVVFHLAADISGVLVRIESGRGCEVSTGTALAWIRPSDD